MIKRSEMQKIASEYTDPKIGVLGSHSALEIMDGAKDEDFETVVYCQKGREVPYQRFNRIADEIKIVFLSNSAGVICEDKALLHIRS